MEIINMANVINIIFFSFILFIIISLLPELFFHFFLLDIFLFTILFVLLPNKRKKLLIIFLVSLLIFFKFYGVSFLEGISNYQTGTARLAQGYGSRSYQLNNKYRLRVYSGFTCSPDIKDIQYEAKNQGIEFMIDNFGYMKSTYTGYYPQKTEIAEAIKKTNKSTIKPNYEKGFFELKINNELIKVYIDTKTYLADLEEKTKTKIDEKLVFNYTNIRYLSTSYNEYIPAKAVFIKDCLVVESLETKNVYLIDSKKGLVFTEYSGYEFRNT